MNAILTKQTRLGNLAMSEASAGAEQITFRVEFSLPDGCSPVWLREGGASVPYYQPETTVLLLRLDVSGIESLIRRATRSKRGASKQGPVTVKRYGPRRLVRGVAPKGGA